MKRIDLTGQRFGRLVVLKHEKGYLWQCRCDCGKKTLSVSYDLRIGRTTSCGCKRNEGVSPTHGMCKTPTYQTWANMKVRCTNPNAVQYKWYGGAGIRLHRSWEKFENFLADMGERPKGCTLDRIDPNKGYTPTNCRWAPKNTGRRKNTPMINGVPLNEAAKKAGLKYHAAYARFRKTGHL